MGVAGGFAAMGVVSMGGALASAGAQKAQADYAASQYRVNQNLAEEQGKIAKSEGDYESGQAALKGKQEVAEQRVHQAATGANVNSGSALDLQSDTAWQSGQNQIMIKNNAWRQAWGYDVQALDYGGQAKMEDLAGANAYSTTLLTGGLQAAGYGMQAYGAYDKYNG